MSTEAWWTQVSAYNEATWPLQVLLVAAAAFLTVRVFARPGTVTDVLVKVFLSFAFAWNGIVFFLVYMRNPVSMFTGVPLFIIAAILFAADIWAKRTHFRLPEERWRKVLTTFWIALAFLYPLLGWPLGHRYPRMLMPMFPCPLTVFALAWVAAAAPMVDRKSFFCLLPWALMGLPKCLGALDCYEDCVLFAAGIYALVILIKYWRVQPSGRRVRRLAEYGGADW
jgi:hypothetical protein